MNSEYKELEEKANWLRKQVLDIAFNTQGGHIGSVYSCIELLVALYYGGILKYDAKNPAWDDRDRFLLGKGHACLGPYNIFVDLGFFDRSILEKYGSDGSVLGDQLNVDIPGAEANTGSLGHMLSMGVGMAVAAKADDKQYRAIVLVGDGEMGEGSQWEAILFAGFHKLDNLVMIIDRNHLQDGADGLSTDDILDIDPLDEKLKSFRWEVTTVDGHKFEEILPALNKKTDKPHAIIANTIKGKGVSFMEDVGKWHGGAPNEEEYKVAVKELS